MNDIEVSSIDLVEGGNVFKQGHYLTLGYVPRDEKGETVDLSGKTLNVSLWGRKGVVFEAAATYSAGVIRFTLDKMVPAGEYTVEFTVTSSTDAKYRKKFPTNQHSGRIAIKQSADDLGVVGIQVYTVAQLKAEQKALLDAAVSGFTVDSETKMARVSGTTTHPTIGARLEADKQATAAQLSEKASNDFVNSIAQAAAGGEPKKVYNTLAELQAAFPTGGDFFSIVKADENWYYWSGTAWTIGGKYLTDTSKLTLTLTNGYITSINHANGEGKIVTSSGGRYSNIFALPKGTKIHIRAGGGDTVSVLSKWTKAGLFVRNLIVGDGTTTNHYYTVVDNVEYLRVTTLIATVPAADVFVKITSNTTDVIDPIYTDVEQMKIDVASVKNVYLENSLSYTDGQFVVSANHPTFTVGTIGTSASYILSNIFTLTKGEQLKIHAVGSPNVIVLSKWNSDGTYLAPVIVGDNVTKDHLYTATADIEYLRISNDIVTLPKSDVFVGKASSLGDTVAGLANDVPDLKATVAGLEINATPNPEMIRLPVINFQFDDGLVSDTNVVTLFKSYGLRCGFAIHSSNTRMAEYLGYQDDGFEILSHSTDAGGFTDETKALSWYLNKMKSSKETLEANGFDIKGWVTPSSQMLDTVIPLLNGLYEYAFTQYLGEWTGVGDPYNTFSESTRRMKRVSMESTTEANCLLAIDQVIADGGMLTFYAHKFPDTNLSEAKLTAILNRVETKINAKQCLVAKPVDAYKHYYTIRHSDLLGLMQ